VTKPGPMRVETDEGEELRAMREVARLRHRVELECAQVESLVREDFLLLSPTPARPACVRIGAATFG
jgi:hypothetical protein